MFFSDSACPFVFKECQIGNARSIVLSVKQGTFKSDVRCSKITVFLIMNVLLDFQMYIRSVLFPRIVISAFTGFVLYLCQD